MRLVAHASAVSCFLHTLCVIQHTIYVLHFVASHRFEVDTKYLSIIQCFFPDRQTVCDLFSNRQVAYIICCSFSHTKTQHLECDCLLLLTTDMNGFSISPSHPLWCRNWCSMSSMIHSSFPFCFLSVSKSFVDCRDGILGRSAEQEWQFSLLLRKLFNSSGWRLKMVHLQNS